MGFTRDLSATGIFFETNVVLATGSLINFAVDIDTPGSRNILKCWGRVIRTEARDFGQGVAVKILKATKEALF